MMKLCSLLLASTLLAITTSAQTITLGTGTLVNPSSAYPAPYGNFWGGARQQYLLTAAELTAAGASAGNLMALGFDVVSTFGAPLQGFTISAGHTLQVPHAAVNAVWESGLSLVYGPVTYTATTGWNTHAFSTPFAWDGASNVMLETCFNNMTFTSNCTFMQTNTGVRSVKLYRADSFALVCFGLDNHYAGLNRPNMQLSFGAPPVPEYQVNQPAAYLDCDTVLATPNSAAIVNKCVGNPASVCANSMGLLADIFMNTVPLVPSSGAGIAFDASHVVNIDISAGFVTLVGSFIPFGAASGTCPLMIGTPLGTLSTQLLSIDATSLFGISISQACQLNGGVNGTLTLPNADDASHLVDLTVAPLCRAWGVPFYGTMYTQIHVSTNGVVCPGTSGQTSWAPSAATLASGPGSLGIWSDWQSNMNPAATIVVNGTGLFGDVDVTYSNVPYWGTAVTSTFNIGIGVMGPRIEGITGLGTDPTATGIVLSQGGGLATDPGATLFAASAMGSTVIPTDMIYNIGAGSPALGGGANNIWCYFSATGVTWNGF